jgi:hypothetical protein
MDDNLKDQQETCEMRPPSELSKDLSDADIKVMVERLFILEDDDLDRLKPAGSRAWWVPVGHEGLREMAALEKLRILMETMQVFGPDGPPDDWEKRREIVYSFSDEQWTFWTT